MLFRKDRLVSQMCVFLSADGELKLTQAWYQRRRGFDFVGLCIVALLHRSLVFLSRQLAGQYQIQTGTKLKYVILLTI